MTIKTKILEATFPESVFTARDPITGLNNLPRREQEIREKIDTFTKSVSIPEIPSISPLGIIRTLLPKIPTIELPNPAEIAQFVNVRIRKEKQKAQEQSIAQLTAAATKENTPFTARQNVLNAEARKNSRG